MSSHRAVPAGQVAVSPGPTHRRVSSHTNLAHDSRFGGTLSRVGHARYVRSAEADTRVTAASAQSGSMVCREWMLPGDSRESDILVFPVLGTAYVGLVGKV